MGYEGFATEAIPKLKERIKVSLWNQRVLYYDYIDDYKPKPLYWKSKFVDPESPDYKKQKSFDEKLDLYGLAPIHPSFGFSFDQLQLELRKRKLSLKGFRFFEDKDTS